MLGEIDSADTGRLAGVSTGHDTRNRSANRA
jgi:hypothetical protein